MTDFRLDLPPALTRQLFTIAGTPINLVTLITFVLIVIFTFAASILIQRTIRLFLQARGVEDEGSVGVITRLTHYLVMGVGVGIGIHTLGINLTALFAAGAVFAIALGFAMQNIAQNFMSGIILLSERSIKPGDILQVDGVMVKVVSLGTRATVARTLEDEDLIIPNANLVQSTVKNYTLRDTLFRVRTVVGVSYASDIQLVQDALLEAARTVPDLSPQREPAVMLQQFGSSSVDFEVSIWIESPWTARAGRSDLNTAIWWALKNAGVTIAFPQVDVHFDPPAVEAFSGRGS